MTYRRHLWLIAAIVFAAARPAVAQSAIAGVVHDPSGAVLPGVTVEASSPALIEGSRTAVTDGGARSLWPSRSDGNARDGQLLLVEDAP